MKFSNETIEVLQNFSLINPSIVFNEGKQLRTMAPTKGCVAYADITDELPSSFGVFNLSQFLSVVSLFETPEFTILDRSMVISEGKESINFVFADPSMIITPPDKEITMPTPEIEFDMPVDLLKRITKAASTLGSPELAVRGDGTDIFFETVNVKNTADNSYSVKIGESDKKFKMIFLIDNVKIMQKDYKVSISSKGISKWAAEGLTYYITTEAKSSKYEG